ncbi:MAG: hypothetical protein HY814_03860 [Candidatus Riflebacteria bacterium]|nr:hypothetical protein [Candidatus Riflebacteria bacterium]
MLLRSLLERKAKHLVRQDQTLGIDPGVLRAMLKVPRYTHGTRSMEAIIDMSMLAGRKTFEQAALPAPEQLQLHVDAKAFLRLVVRDVHLAAVREVLARANHEEYLQNQKDKKPPTDPSMQPWEELPESLKESNRSHAAHIPVKLALVSCDFSPVPPGREPVPFEFTAEEVELLARVEHDRWVAERLEAGWRPGPRDPVQKTTPYLVGWDALTEEVREWDRQPVRALPKFLAKAGFEVYRGRK